MEGINHELPAPLESEFAEIAWGIPKSGEKHAPIWIARPKVTDSAVRFEMLYCGICHSDVHTGVNDWGQSGCLAVFTKDWFQSFPIKGSKIFH